MNNFNRHWFRHFYCSLLPSWYTTITVRDLAWFSRRLLPTPYQIIRACAPEWSYVKRIAKDFESRITEDCASLTENWMFGHWVYSCVSYVKWYRVVQADYSLPLSTFLDPPAVCFRPDRKDQLSILLAVNSNFLVFSISNVREIQML
ncbi:hypothetical protein ACOSQ3_019932 [Xanthoceras sorbifolium]